MLPPHNNQQVDAPAWPWCWCGGLIMFQHDHDVSGACLKTVTASFFHVEPLWYFHAFADEYGAPPC